MKYHLSLSGPFLCTHGKRYFSSLDELYHFAVFVYEESLPKAIKAFGHKFSHEALLAGIEVTLIDEKIRPDYFKYFLTRKMKKNIIKKPKIERET